MFRRMFKTDYILRLIEEAVRAVTLARAQRQAGAPAEALDLLEKTAESLVGLSPTALVAMPLGSLLDLLRHDAKLDSAKTLLLARLLQERALLAEAVGQAAQAYERRAFLLYDTVLCSSPAAPELPGYETAIAALMQRLA